MMFPTHIIRCPKYYIQRYHLHISALITLFENSIESIISIIMKLEFLEDILLCIPNNREYISSLSCNSVTTQNFIVLSYLHHPKAQILLCR